MSPEETMGGSEGIKAEGGTLGKREASFACDLGS